MSRPRSEATPILRRGPDEIDSFKGMSTTLLTSAAFRSVRPSHLKLYLDLIARHNGFNNGRIVLGSRDAAAATGLSRPTVLKAFERLEEIGLIICTRKGDMLLDDNGKFSAASERYASEWEITDYHTWSGDDPVEPKRTYTDWCDNAGAIVPGSRSKELPKPRMPKPKQRSVAAKPTGTARVHSKPHPTRAPTVKRPASLSAIKPAPRAPSRSQRSEPVIPESASPAPQHHDDDQRMIARMIRDDAAYMLEHGSERGPVWTGKDWVHQGVRISPERAEQLDPSPRRAMSNAGMPDEDADLPY